MDIRQLRQFIAIAENLSFRRAAEQLDMAQPNLSQTIKLMESELGVKLFERNKRDIALTPPGQALLGEARQIVDHLVHAIAITQRVGSGVAGRLRLGFVTSATYGFLPQAVRAFRRKYAEVELSFREGGTVEMLRWLDDHQVDIALSRPLPEVASRYNATPVLRDVFVAALPSSHRLAQKASLSLRDLRDEPIIGFTSSGSPSLTQQIMNASRDAGFTPRIVQDGRQVQTLLSHVAAGLGIALVPAAVRVARQPDVTFRHFSDFGPQLELELLAVTRLGDDSPLTRAFVEVAAGAGSAMAQEASPRAAVPARRAKPARRSNKD